MGNGCSGSSAFGDAQRDPSRVSSHVIVTEFSQPNRAPELEFEEADEAREIERIYDELIESRHLRPYREEAGFCSIRSPHLSAWQSHVETHFADADDRVSLLSSINAAASELHARAHGLSAVDQHDGFFGRLLRGELFDNAADTEQKPEQPKKDEASDEQNKQQSQKERAVQLDRPDAERAALGSETTVVTALAARKAIEALVAVRDRGGSRTSLLGNPLRPRDDDHTFGTSDVRWQKCFAEFVDFKLKQLLFAAVPPYVAPKDLDTFAVRRFDECIQPARPDCLRVLLVSDWATGTREALALLATAAKSDPDVVIHLGDVYYSGSEDEQRQLYESMDAVFDRSKVLCLNMPGNHDMFSGGAPYHKYREKLSNGHQQASFFAFHNDAWQIQAMDTAFHDSDPFDSWAELNMTRLTEQEAEWHRRQLDKALAAGRRVLLLSHHQLFSTHSTVGRDPGSGREPPLNVLLYNDLKDYLPRVTAWFWGHEHSLVMHKPYHHDGKLLLARGRCIGHGAVPVKGSEMYKATDDHDTETFRRPDFFQQEGCTMRLKNWTRDRFAAHGFVVLDLFNDGRGEAKYFEFWRGKPSLRCTEILADNDGSAIDRIRMRLAGDANFVDMA